MTTADLGPWEPLSVADVIEQFEPARFRWWLAGGHALETHLSRRGDEPQNWRQHDDTDIGISRHDAPALRHLLARWDVHTASDGVLTPWSGEPLNPAGSDQGVTNLWCRPDPSAAWALDVLLGEGNDVEWVYRRDPSIRRPWAETVLRSPDGVPYLAPEIQLLFKSRTIRPKDQVDAIHVIPRLDPERRAWLIAHLSENHPWLAIAMDADR